MTSRPDESALTRIRPKLIPPEVELPIRGITHAPLDPVLLEGLQGVSSATAASILYLMGIRKSALVGPRPQTPTKKVIGPALTLQFVPKREDVVQGVLDAAGIPEEFAASKTALWAAVEATQPGDVIVVQAYGDPETGCLGEMLIGYLKQQGGLGVVVDGSVRDMPRLLALDVGVWSNATTPNSATQGSLYPWAFEVPIACGGVLVLPGDVVLADDDGVVVIPRQLAALVVEQSQLHEDWEEFSRKRIAEGGALTRYYPLEEDAWQEYFSWRASMVDGNGGPHPS